MVEFPDVEERRAMLSRLVAIEDKVYVQVEGFEGVKATSGKHKGKRSVVAGWKYEGLPCSYDLVTEKMYFNFDPKYPQASTAHAQ